MTLEIYDIHPHILSEDSARYPSQPLRGKQSDWSRDRPQTFEQLVAEMDAAGVAKAAIVQASTYYGYDNSYVADCVSQHPGRFTGVGSIDVLAPDAIKVFDGWLARGISGLRLFTGGATHATDADWLVDPRSFPVWERAVERGVTICVQTTPIGLDNVRTLLERFAGARVVLDHAGRPSLEDGAPYEGARSLFELAAYPNLFVKVTPRTFALAQKGRATPETFFGALAAAFGADRIAFGSNLPANEGPMTTLVEEAKRCLASLSKDEQAQILSGTAKRLYPALA